MPATFDVIMVIFDSGILGSMGAVASIMMVPTKPEQCAIPLASTVTPAGTGAAVNAIPIDHIAGGDITFMGAMLYMPVAVN